MTLVPQKTLGKSICFSGIGVHSGNRVEVTLRPGDVDTGIRFFRTDIGSNDAWVKPSASRVIDTKMCTRIASENGTSIGTIEHFMSALRAANIDNIVIEIDGPECPIMDGSAGLLVFLINCCGTTVQNLPRRAIKIIEPVEVNDKDNDRFVAFYPYEGALFDFSIDFPHPHIGKDSLRFDLVNGDFASDISRARTFGFRADLDRLRSLSLAQGGSLDNAILLDENGVQNPEGLRYKNEFVRHKLLDAIGDTFIEGLPIIGHYVGHKAGHEMTSRLMKTMLNTPHAWTYTQDLSGLVPTTENQATAPRARQATGDMG